MEMTEAPSHHWAALRFWPHVSVAPSGCWAWTGTKMGAGYGSLKPAIGSPATGAHRFSWALHNGSWPEKGRVVMHSCDNPSCVNPAHLMIGTQSENIRQCVERGRHVPYRSHPKMSCKNGHPYDEENTETVRSGKNTIRRCKTCSAETNAKWREKNRKILADRQKARRIAAKDRIA